MLIGSFGSLDLALSCCIQHWGARPGPVPKNCRNKLLAWLVKDSKIHSLFKSSKVLRACFIGDILKKPQTYPHSEDAPNELRQQGRQ